MDFESEPFVRLYVRDTATWNDLGFAGQTTLMHLLRRANLAGAVYLTGGMEPWQAAVSLCGVPEAIARAGAQKLLELGCAILESGKLVFPRYVAAQSAAASQALRQQESRARKQLQKGDDPDPERIPKRWAEPPEPSQSVTEVAEATVWDPVFGARRRVLGPQVLQAARGAAWLAEATGLEPWAHGGRWASALAQLAAKPEAERKRAAKTLRAAATHQDAGRILTPQHVLDYWQGYVRGWPPGAPMNGKANGNGHREPQPGPPEVEAARAESERWKQKYERARTDYERNLAMEKWLEADRKLKSAREKTGWNA